MPRRTLVIDGCAQHTLFLVVEADDVDAVHKFLWPGFKRGTSTVTPVSEVPVPKP